MAKSIIDSITKDDIVVIGNGMVGQHFVQNLREQSPNCSIRVLSGEPRLAYDRVHLSEFFSGKTADDLAMTTPEHYASLNVSFHTNAWVPEIVKVHKMVSTKAGQQ